MLTSQQVAALIGQQNGQFMGSAQYAQQISAQMPQPYMGGPGGIGGLGAFGSSGAAMAPNMSGPPAFSYGSGAYGYGPGNRAGALGTSALGGAAGMGIGLGADLGAWSAGAGMFGAARAGGMGMMGAGAMGMAAAAPIFLAGQAAQWGVGQAVAGAQGQQQIGRSLGQFNFSNPSATGGHGFTRQDSMQIGNMVRQMAALPEMLTSSQELTRIVEKMGQTGMMQGVHDAQTFQRKFKDGISALKDIAKVMGTTMEDALGIFQQSKMSGFYSKTDIAKNIINTQTTMGLTGMSAGQVGQLQQAGGQMAFNLGGSRQGGAKLFTRTAEQIGAAVNMGALTPDQITEITGLTGAEGKQALAQSLGQATYKMSRSSMGTAMALAMGKQKDGRYIGGVDEEMLERFQAGEFSSKGALLGAAHGRLGGGRKGRLSFGAHRSRITTDVAGEVGVTGFVSQLQNLMERRGMGSEDALDLVSQRFGLDEQMQGAVRAMNENMPNIKQEIAVAAQNKGIQAAQQAKMSTNMSPDAIKQKLKTKISNAFFKPELNQLGADISNTIATATDRFFDSFITEHMATIDTATRQTAVAASQGNKGAIAKMKATAAQLSGVSVGGKDLSGGDIGYFGKALATDPFSAMFAQTAGEEYRSKLLGLGGEDFMTKGTRAEAAKAGATYLGGQLSRNKKGGGEETVGWMIKPGQQELLNQIGESFGLRNDTTRGRAKGMEGVSTDIKGHLGGSAMKEIMETASAVFGTDSFRSEMRGAKTTEEKNKVITKYLREGSKGGKGASDAYDAVLGAGYMSSEINARVQHLVGAANIEGESAKYGDSGLNLKSSSTEKLREVAQDTYREMSRGGEGGKQASQILQGADSETRQLLIKAMEGDSGAAAELERKGQGAALQYVSKGAGKDLAIKAAAARDLGGRAALGGQMGMIGQDIAHRLLSLGDKDAPFKDKKFDTVKAALSKFAMEMSGVKEEAGSYDKFVQGHAVEDALAALSGVKDPIQRKRLASKAGAGISRGVEVEEEIRTGHLSRSTKELLREDTGGKGGSSRFAGLLAGEKQDEKSLKELMAAGGSLASRTVFGGQAAKIAEQDATKEAAAALKVLSENVKVTAQMLANIQSGKKPGDKE